MRDFPAAEKFILEKQKQELPANLSYHGIHHVLDVLKAALEIADSEKITDEDRKLLRLAVLFHDAGFIHTYQGHEEKGCGMAAEMLPSFGFEKPEVDIICGMIRATKLPQLPGTRLERIIADADLDYLGRDDFYPISRTLYEEFRTWLNVHNENEWNLIQLNFLRSHHYHTDYSIEKREPMKLQRLHEIEKLVRG
jgi:uncharacterized protein